MIEIDRNDIKIKYPGFYNIYPIQQEISLSSNIGQFADTSAKLLLDDYYGRMINPNTSSVYGDSNLLDYYFSHYSKKCDEYLRVPFRKIPVFEFVNLEEIKAMIKMIEENNSGYEILLRGQCKQYTLQRSKQETKFLYGEETVIEPSFQPSFLRNNFNEYFIYNLWHSQLALMLNDVGIDLSEYLSKTQMQEYYSDVDNIKSSPHFTPIALGIAQHYGFPSIGLDLTKDINVATWFATNSLKINDDGNAKTEVIKNFDQSTIYIFRCPKDSVFSHKNIKPKFIENTRPDRQDAWFSHVGWGYSKNQLASYLVCAIRLKPEAADSLDKDLDEYLFPNRDKDLVLNYFLDAKSNPKYKGEVKEAFKKIYVLNK